MYGKRKMSGKAYSIPAGLAAGAAASIGITLLGSVLSAVCVEKGWMSWDSVGYVVMVMLLLASYTGSVMAFRRIKRQKVLICFLSGWIYWGMLLLVTALAFGGNYEAVGVTLLLIIGGSGCAAFLGRGERTRKQGAVRKMRY